MPNGIPGVERYVEILSQILPSWTGHEQRAAVTLYRQLARGSPVRLEDFAQALDAPTTTARAMLEQQSFKALIYNDEEGRIIGFGGLAVVPMNHSFTVNGRRLWTWCAWDSLFIPRLLGASARVQSSDPETGEPVSLEIAPNGVAVAPPTYVVSFLQPDSSAFRESARSILTKFCHFVFFFGSHRSGEQWVASHPGTFVYSLEDAVSIARRLNERTFGLELARLASLSSTAAVDA